MQTNVTQLPDSPPPAPPRTLPTWLRAHLADDEQVAWWDGPDVGPWTEWCKNREGELYLIPFACFFGFPLLGLLLGPFGFIGGAMLGVGAMIAFSAVMGATDKFRWQVVTNKRLFFVVGRNKTEEFDLALLRQLLASMAPPAVSEQVFDMSKVGPATVAASHGITDLASLLAVAKVMQQAKAVKPS